MEIEPQPVCACVELAAESFGIGIRPEGPPLPPLSALSSLPLGSSGEAAQSLSGWSRAAEGQLAEAEATTTTAQRTRRRKKGTAGAGSSTRRARQDAGAGEEEEEGNEEEWEEQELEEGEGEEEDEEEEDADALGRQADWSDAPPEGFRAELSTFGTLWMALEEWVSAEAVAFILGQPYSREEEGTLEVEGRQYQPQVSPPAGSSSSGVSVAIARTFSDCVGRALPELIQRLRMTVSLSLVEQTLARLVNRLSFVEALPPLGTLQWRLVALLLLEAAGAHHVPAVAAHLSSQKKLFHQVIESTGTSVEEYLIFRQLTLPKDSSKALFAEASPRKGA